MKEKDHLKDLCIDGRIILVLIFENGVEMCGLDLSESG
jgi:hypothetical protein